MLFIESEYCKVLQCDGKIMPHAALPPFLVALNLRSCLFRNPPAPVGGISTDKLENDIRKQLWKDFQSGPRNGNKYNCRRDIRLNLARHEDRAEKNPSIQIGGVCISSLLLNLTTQAAGSEPGNTAKQKNSNSKGWPLSSTTFYFPLQKRYDSKKVL